jgi:hypothetical protein
MEKNKITITYVRHKLGKKAERMTDEELNNLLNTLRILCNRAIDSAIKKGETN